MSPPPVISTDLVVRDDLENFIGDLRPFMARIVAGETSLPFWIPNGMVMSEEFAAHMEAIQIPSLNGKPSVLLHGLGSFKREAALAARLKNIFMPNHHTCVGIRLPSPFIRLTGLSFLVNTSGSGKTRLLLEGLCDHWGFYFTSLVDSSLLGSSDVQNSIRFYIPESPDFRATLPPVDSPDHKIALQTNRDHASRIFSRLFLARLFILDLFVQIMKELRFSEPGEFRAAVYRKRWLLLQLQPSLLHPQIWDIFDELVDKLSPASESYVNGTTKTLLIRIRKRLTEMPDSRQHRPSDTQTPMFCVLDEAQYAATQHFNAFKSDTGNAPRPILREIVKAWERQSSGHGIFMVVAGTGISKDIVDQAMASAIMKESKYRWCSDTGAFDDLDEQRRYVEKYLPPSLLSSNSGMRLIRRIGYWLRGRSDLSLSIRIESLVITRVYTYPLR